MMDLLMLAFSQSTEMGVGHCLASLLCHSPGWLSLLLASTEMVLRSIYLAWRPQKHNTDLARGSNAIGMMSI